MSLGLFHLARIVPTQAFARIPVTLPEDLPVLVSAFIRNPKVAKDPWRLVRNFGYQGTAGAMKGFCLKQLKCGQYKLVLKSAMHGSVYTFETDPFLVIL